MSGNFNSGRSPASDKHDRSEEFSRLQEDEIPIWQRLPDESVAGYEAFFFYAQLGIKRSLAQVKERYKKSTDDPRVYIAGEFTEGSINEYSRRYQWKIRATAYDAHLMAIEQGARELAIRERAQLWAARREELRDKEWETAQKLRERADEMLAHPFVAEVEEESEEMSEAGLVLKTIKKIEPARWTLADAVRYYEAAAKMMRMAAGVETDRVKKLKQPVESMSDEELDRLIEETEQQ